MTRSSWKPGDALPPDDAGLWTYPMCEQFFQRCRRTLQRRGLPSAPGFRGLFVPSVVRAFARGERPGIRADDPPRGDSR